MQGRAGNQTCALAQASKWWSECPTFPLICVTRLASVARFHSALSPSQRSLILALANQVTLFKDFFITITPSPTPIPSTSDSDFARGPESYRKFSPTRNPHPAASTYENDGPKASIPPLLRPEAQELRHHVDSSR